MGCFRGSPGVLSAVLEATSVDTQGGTHGTPAVLGCTLEYSGAYRGWFCVCVFACVCICVCVSISVRERVRVCIRLRVPGHVCLCVRARACVPATLHFRASVCVRGSRLCGLSHGDRRYL